MRDERHDDAIDELIANAAKALTTGEPTRSLRSGVRERITRRAGAWSRVPAWGLAAATVILAVVAGRYLTAPVDDDRAAPSPRQVVASVPSPAAQRPRTTAQADAGQAVAVPEPRPRRAVAAALLPEEEDPVIPPLTIAPLSTTQIAVDMSPGVMPIEIEPLQIEPLQGSGQ